MIFLRINIPSFDLEARTLRSCYIHLLRYFNAICPRPKNGTFGVPGRPRPGRGTIRPRYGTFREIRDGWQPYVHHRHVSGLKGGGVDHVKHLKRVPAAH